MYWFQIFKQLERYDGSEKSITVIYLQKGCIGYTQINLIPIVSSCYKRVVFLQYHIIYSFYFHVIRSRVIMEEIEKLKNVLTENNVTEVRKIESNFFEQINRLIEKI